ncbi:MAG: bifunctional phosphopantothenoylcysteine decarboxylase/phosphopantothenate--cysteine ligase CoaBC [Gammaproteobacteria bacterium]|nr:MAG: bifunctional phosphopantothenoylcysteine decarboxylase/phosphopantothenate--cysteine ligase CoaBC [Gammaproteobacteria bacterium]
MKKILLGITGSIAAYKCAELIRQLQKNDCDVRVIMTTSATLFITPMTLQTLSRHKVRVDLFSHEDEEKIDHISLARWADEIIIAPATANFMAKITIGLADDLLTTVCLASDCPKTIAPAMNRLMWENIATQTNYQILQTRGYHFIAPDSGEQACGETGVGRMAEPDYIVKQLCPTTPPLLLGKTLIITAGPTIERIDPVRFISNDSSGKMGYALAEQAALLGANVLLVSGKTALPCPNKVKRIVVESAQQMLTAVLQEIDNADWFIAAAAVSDYTVDNPALQKLKKSDDKGLTLTLVQNPDILKTVCQRSPKPFCIGFAAETEQLIKYATAKRLRKGADLIVANDVSNSEIGFNSDNNAVTLIGEDFIRDFPQSDKTTLAKALLKSAFTYEQSHSLKQ